MATDKQVLLKIAWVYRWRGLQVLVKKTAAKDIKDFKIIRAAKQSTSSVLKPESLKQLLMKKSQ